MASLMPNFDAEACLYALECEIDTLEKISDGLPDDRTTSNALIGVHGRLCKLHADLKIRLMEN